MSRRAARLGLLLWSGFGLCVRVSHAQQEQGARAPEVEAHPFALEAGVAETAAPEAGVAETAAPPASSPPETVPAVVPSADPPSPPIDSVTVRAPREVRSLGGTSLQVGAETRGMAGALGDGLAVAQSLPGVARPQAGQSQIVVWGAAPSESRIYVDDVPIPYLYHRGGLRSVVGADLVSSLELVPAGFGVGYGRATGGLLKLRTSLLSADGLHGHVSVDPLDSSASVRYTQPEGRGPWAFAVGGRYGYLDRLLRAVAPGSTFPASAYADLATKVVHRDDNATTDFISRRNRLDSAARTPASRTGTT